MAQKPGQYSVIGGRSIQAHCLEPGALPTCKGRYPSNQPVLSLFDMADHYSGPLCPVGVDQVGGESLFREFIRQPADCQLDVYKDLSGDFSPWIVFTHNRHQNALPSASGVAKLPSLFGTQPAHPWECPRLAAVVCLGPLIVPHSRDCSPVDLFPRP
jgi:hypothetical protein